MRQITRHNVPFVVQDIEHTISWNFWGQFENGTWESGTFAALDSVLRPGDLLFDVGAWVGPITLWEAARGVHVVAFEPQPAAYENLFDNVALNSFRDRVITVNSAITPFTEDVMMGVYSDGDSLSSLVRFTENQVLVHGLSLGDAIAAYGTPAVIKIDIEGGEALVLPKVGPLLRELGVIMHLSTHAIWYPEGTREAIEEELSHWNMRTFDDHEDWLCTPK